MASQELEGHARRVERIDVDEPWDAFWGEDVRVRLQRAAEVVARAVNLSPTEIGLLPAVYFPRLRMGAVTFRWPADADIAFPWRPPHVPPPFTCFAPPIATTEESDVNLIARVGSLVDRVYDATAHPPVLHQGPGETEVGTVTWMPGRNSLAGVVDADDLLAARVEQASAAFLIPSRAAPPAYVPLLYAHAAKTYRDEHFDALMRAAVSRESTAIGSPFDEIGAVADALRLAAEAARVCATRWLNPKTLLLNQAGFDFVKDDLQRRVAAGELYAEIFFDIDDFKMKNDRHGYVGADLVAARLVDRVLFAVQQEVAEEHAAFRAQQDVPHGAPNSFRALIAHVSGDEFKLFVRSNARRELVHDRRTAAEHPDVARVRAFAERLVAATVAERAVPISERAMRHARTFAIYTPAERFTEQHLIADDRATVSAGVALVATADGWPISEIDYRIHRYPEDSRLTEAARDALNDLDGLSERALSGAKRVTEKVLLSDELVDRGGRLQVVAHEVPHLLLGSIDGIRVGDEFSVFTTSDRSGKPFAVVRVLALEEEHRRWAPVEMIDGTNVEPRREDYYLRFRGPMPVPQGTTAVLRGSPETTL